MKKNKIKALIFDFDGVLVDTEYTTFSFYKKILPLFGFKLKDQDFEYKIGRKSIDFFKDVLKKDFDEELIKKIIELKREAFLRNIKKYLKPVPGAFKFLEKVKSFGFDLALASQNEKILIEKAVDVFKIRKYFKVILSLQDISHKKPHPELFLKAAQKLKVSPKKAIVFEDTKEGIIAAKKGGFKIICLTTSFSKNDLKGADLIIDSFSEIDFSKLKIL